MKTIRNINIEDFDIINQLFVSEISEFHKFSDIGWGINGIKSHLCKKNNFSLGYSLNNKIYGVLIGEKIANDTKYDLEVHIMFVSKYFRSYNIGTSLLKFIEINKDLNNITKIYLEVSENNSNAIRFYEKNNFVFFKFRHNYYKNNNNVINAKCYYKTI